MALAAVALADERYEEAAASARRAAQSNANFSTAYFLEAFALALAGHMEEARHSATLGLALEPGFQFRGQWRIAPALLEKFIQGARLLGLAAE
jgi:hypothetical protein